jgi:hypothetical protein
VEHPVHKQLLIILPPDISLRMSINALGCMQLLEKWAEYLLHMPFRIKIVLEEIT